MEQGAYQRQHPRSEGVGRGRERRASQGCDWAAGRCTTRGKSIFTPCVRLTDDADGTSGAKESAMQHLLMICDQEKDQPQFGSPEFIEYMKRWMQLDEEYQAKGMLLKGGGKLDSVAKAKTVRVRGGKVQVSDGPFAETKEVMGGYTVIECDTIDEAIAYAATIPVAEWGSVEIRPFVRSQYEKGT
jgi:hypothetical protein